MATFSPQFIAAMQSAYAATKARLPERDALEAASRILGEHDDLNAAKAAITESVAPSRR